LAIQDGILEITHEELTSSSTCLSDVESVHVCAHTCTYVGGWWGCTGITYAALII